MLDHGADGNAFGDDRRGGPNSAIPHHRPTDAVLRTGDFVKIDFRGARVGGYHSDMTRTFVLRAAADWQREIYGLVADAQRAGRNALEPGPPSNDVDAAARTVIVDAGYGETFSHGLGHGLGCRFTRRRDRSGRHRNSLGRQCGHGGAGVYLPRAGAECESRTPWSSARTGLSR